MIYALIALIGEGVVIAALAIIAVAALRRNSRLERERGIAWQDSEEAQRDLEAALAGKEELRDDARLGKAALSENVSLATMLKAEIESHKKMRLLYDSLLRERNELAARSTALQEALEAKPTGPSKRVVRKNTSTPQTTEEEARQAEQAARYNREMDERNRISAENRDKPWLP